MSRNHDCFFCRELEDRTDNLLGTNGMNYIVKNDNYPSQFFRAVACRAMGIPKYWNWRDYPFRENMLITLDYYEGLGQ